MRAPSAADRGHATERGEPTDGARTGRDGGSGSETGAHGRGPSGAFRTDFVAGVRDMSPLFPAAVTVGLVTGVAADAVGIAPLQAVAMAVLVYSPSVLLTAFQLLRVDAPTAVLVVTALVVGVRFVILSLSIAPYFSHLARRWRWLLAYFLWTPVYALSIGRFEDESATNRRGYYLGAGASLWAVVQVSYAAGVGVGATLPSGAQLTFVIPLAFIALVVDFLDDRATVAAALVAGVVAVGGVAVPLNLGVVVATVAGTAAGVVASSREGWR